MDTVSRGQLVLRIDIGGPPIEFFADQVTRVVAYNRSTLDAYEMIKAPHDYLWVFEPESEVWVDEVLVYLEDTDHFVRHPANMSTNAALIVDLRAVHRPTATAVPSVDRLKG